MRAQPYVPRLKRHLAAYKKDVLGVAEDGAWSRTGRTYPHILPATHRELNLLAPLRVEMQAYLSAMPTFRYHRDFHHLNSSQAMCLNLVLPALRHESARAGLVKALGHHRDFDVEGACFEKVLDEAEGTNFDFFLTKQDGGIAVFEFKLSEAGFGTAAADERHLEKLQQIYVPRLSGRVASECLAPARFFAAYQLYRNLSYLASPHDELIIVLPRAHSRLAVEAQAFVSELNGPLRQKVRLLFMEDLAQHLLDATRRGAGKVHEHYKGFALKYCLSV